MSALYVDFDLEQIPVPEQKGFEKRVLQQTNSLLARKNACFLSDNFCGAIAHQGVFPSCGIASSDRAAIAIAGSCWVDPLSNALVTPNELLSQWQEIPFNTGAQAFGLFSLGYFDRENVGLIIESDRFGGMPLYYRASDSGISVSSEIKFLLRPGFDETNIEAAAEMMELGYLSRHHTLVKGIYRLPANSRLVFSEKGLKIEKFPLPSYSRHRPLDSEALSEYDQMIRRYFERFDGVPGPFGCSLSGGLDSRLVACAAKRAGFDIRAFTTGERPSLDSKIAQKVAESLGIPIRFFRIDPREMPDWFESMVWLTEGRVHPGHMHYMSAGFHGVIPQGPLLHGIGLEGVLGGHYDNPKLISSGYDEIHKECLSATSGLNYWRKDSRKAIFSNKIRQYVDNTIDFVSKDLFKRIEFKGEYRDFIEYRTQLKGVSWARPCILGQVMPWAEVVDPFFDHHAFDFGTTLALEGIFDRAGQLRWGLEFFPDFGEIPRVKSGVLIPIGVFQDNAYQRGMERLFREAKIKYYIGRLTQGRINLPMKNSFPQYWQWYPKYRQVREYVDGILLSDQTMDRGYLMREGVKSLLHDCRVGRRVWNAVGTLLMVEICLRQFIDGSTENLHLKIPSK